MSNKGQVSTIGLVLLIVGIMIGAGVGYFVAPKGVSQEGYDAMKTERDQLQTKVDGYEQLDKVTFRLDWLSAAQQSPWFLGEAEGFFEDEQIDLEIISGSGSSDSIKEVGAKSVTFALCDTLVLVQGVADNEMPVRAVGVYYVKTPISLISLNESDITELSDIIGKKIGVVIQSTTYQGLKAVCAANGIDFEEDLEKITVGFGVTPLLVGQVDVLTAFTMNEPNDAITKGYEVNEIMISDYGVELYGLTIITHLDTIEDNPDLVRRFVRASVRSIEHAILHPQMSVDALLEAVPDARPDFEALAMEKMVNIGLLQDEITGDMGTCYSTEEKWTAAQDLIYSLGLIETTLEDVSAFFTNEFLP
jgi:NitT/TauT family transport system substrate-binding protein